MSLHRLPYCRDCLRKQQEIDRLKEENARLKGRLRYQERNAKEAPFGSATPSAKRAVKPNSLEDNQKKKGGAKLGHAGSGRRQPPPEEVTRTQRVSAARTLGCSRLSCHWRRTLSVNLARRFIRIRTPWAAGCFIIGWAFKIRSGCLPNHPHRGNKPAARQRAISSVGGGSSAVAVVQ